MGVKKTISKEGDGATVPQKGSAIKMHYTGWVYDPNAPDNKGNK